MISTHKRVINTRHISTLFKMLIAAIFLCILCFGYLKYQAYQNEQFQTQTIISSPQINDIYFIDFRLLAEFNHNKLRPTEKYRIAKVIDVTGDIITLVYGAFYYQRQHAAINSIQYGQLSYTDYFEPKRYDIPLNKIKDMRTDEAIYLAKRPVRNKLYGSLIGPEKSTQSSHLYTYGKKENRKGEVYLKALHSETNLESAFGLFQKSADLGFATGQINLAEMYINGASVEKDLTLALHWLKQASLQSNKAAIFKYGIICKQVPNCNVLDFYQEMNNKGGVNIKIRQLDFKLDK